MNQRTLAIQIITPCFSAGADQLDAEIRAPAIRGQLRWWFRVLGGAAEEEKALFGGIDGDARASVLVTRVADFKAAPQVKLPSRIGEQLYYLAHFAKERCLHDTACLAPDSSFSLRLSFRKPLPEPLMAKFALALEAFERLGTVGYRSSRGFGAVANLNDIPDFDTFASWSRRLGGVLVTWAEDTEQKPVIESDWRKSLAILESLLRTLRKEPNQGAKSRTPLGCASPRQSSALKLRPVRLKEGFLPVVVYTEAAIDTKKFGSLRDHLEGHSFEHPYNVSPTNDYSLAHVTG